jgi:hypothetical protein
MLLQRRDVSVACRRRLHVLTRCHGVGGVFCVYFWSQGAARAPETEGISLVEASWVKAFGWLRITARQKLGCRRLFLDHVLDLECNLTRLDFLEVQDDVRY